MEYFFMGLVIFFAMTHILFEHLWESWGPHLGMFSSGKILHLLYGYNQMLLSWYHSNIFQLPVSLAAQLVYIWNFDLNDSKLVGILRRNCENLVHVCVRCVCAHARTRTCALCPRVLKKTDGLLIGFHCWMQMFSESFRI